MRKWAFPLMMLLAVSCRADSIPGIFFCPTSCNGPANQIPNLLINPLGIMVGLSGKGVESQSPTLILVGVYNGDDLTPAPQVTLGGNVYGAGAAGVWGLPKDHAQITGGDVYEALGVADLNGGNNAETFTKLAAADGLMGLPAATSFEIFGFTLPIGLMSGVPTTEIAITGAPFGSFVLGYGCLNGDSGLACPSGSVVSTPFSNAGLLFTPSAPEPATSLLMAIGIAMLAVMFKLIKSDAL